MIQTRAHPICIKIKGTKKIPPGHIDNENTLEQAETFKTGHEDKRPAQRLAECCIASITTKKEREMFRKNTIEGLKAKALHRYCRLLDTNVLIIY